MEEENFNESFSEGGIEDYESLEHRSLESGIEEKSFRGMENLNIPKSLSLSGDIASNWKKWRQSFELYMIASGGSTKEENIKVALLLHVLGEEALEVYNSFDMTEAEKVSYNNTMTKFQEYCVPQSNTSVESCKFNTRVQGQTESFDSFVSDLRKLRATSDFGNLRDRLIIDRIVQGVRDIKLKAKLLAEAGLTLTRAVELWKAAEQTYAQLKSMDNSASNVDPAEIDAIGFKNSTAAASGRVGGRSSQKSSVAAWTERGRGSERGARRGSKRGDHMSMEVRKPVKAENGYDNKMCYRCGYNHGSVSQENKLTRLLRIRWKRMKNFLLVV